MIRTLVLSMLVLSTIVAVAGEASAATDSPYAVAKDLTVPFFVMGNSASLSQITGVANIASTQALAGGLLRVNVHCSSLELCTGLVIGA